MNTKGWQNFLDCLLRFGNYVWYHQPCHSVSDFIIIVNFLVHLFLIWHSLLSDFRFMFHLASYFSSIYVLLFLVHFYYSRWFLDFNEHKIHLRGQGTLSNQLNAKFLANFNLYSFSQRWDLMNDYKLAVTETHRLHRFMHFLSKSYLSSWGPYCNILFLIKCLPRL
jgi:hypothetical protein